MDLDALPRPGETVVEIVSGSRLHGTATAASDTDVRRIHVLPARDVLLGRVEPVLAHRTKIARNARNAPEDVDYISSTLQRYLSELAGGDSIALETLFAPAAAIRAAAPLWSRVVAGRDRVLSRAVGPAAAGYARRQAGRYGILGGRVNALEVLAENVRAIGAAHGERAPLGVDLAKLRRIVAGLDHPDVSLEDAHLRFVNKRAALDHPIAEAQRVLEAALRGYGSRSEAAARNEGVDWRAVAHGLRATLTATEVLRTGAATFPRPEATRLRLIRAGRVAYREAAVELEDALADLAEATRTSPLPERPDLLWIDALVEEAHADAVRRSYGLAPRRLSR